MACSYSFNVSWERPWSIYHFWSYSSQGAYCLFFIDQSCHFSASSKFREEPLHYSTEVPCEDASYFHHLSRPFLVWPVHRSALARASCLNVNRHALESDHAGCCCLTIIKSVIFPFLTERPCLELCFADADLSLLSSPVSNGRLIHSKR